jgi:nucleoid-associated protein YgaU
MLVKKSRYRNARTFESLADGTQVFSGIRAREIGAATGVIEHEVQAGQRLDQLARHYYNDDRLWWRIVDANPEFTLGLDILDSELEGRVILIPKVKE